MGMRVRQIVKVGVGQVGYQIWDQGLFANDDWQEKGSDERAAVSLDTMWSRRPQKHSSRTKTAQTLEFGVDRFDGSGIRKPPPHPHPRTPSHSPPAFGTCKMLARATQTAETHQHAANLLWPQLVDEHTVGSPVRRRFPHLRILQGSMTLGGTARRAGDGRAAVPL